MLGGFDLSTLSQLKEDAEVVEDQKFMPKHILPNRFLYIALRLQFTLDITTLMP